MADNTLVSREQAMAYFSGEFRRALDSIPPETLALTIQELELERKPTEIDVLLRKSLWKLVENAAKGEIFDIPTAHVYSHICTQQGFDRVMKHPTRLAWILTPPREMKERMHALLEVGFSQLERLISQPLTKENSATFLRAFELLMNRVHGPIIQRVDARHAHINLNKPVAPPPQIKPPDINERLESIREKINAAKDVTPVEQKNG